jgi:hypothetical protein
MVLYKIKGESKPSLSKKQTALNTGYVLGCRYPLWKTETAKKQGKSRARETM